MNRTRGSGPAPGRAATAVRMTLRSTAPREYRGGISSGQRAPFVNGDGGSVAELTEPRTAGHAAQHARALPADAKLERLPAGFDNDGLAGGRDAAHARKLSLERTGRGFHACPPTTTDA